jgi:ketosteroid isomerase-like protein
MPQENLEIVRSAYAALAERGLEAVLELADPAFETTTPAALASEPGTYRGHDGIRRWFASFGDAMEDVRLEAQELTAVGDKVVVETMLRARGRATGIETKQRAFLVWTLRDGRLMRLDTFAERGQALAAAGLPDPSA